MFKRLRFQLTLICAVGTGLVLTAMALVALTFSLEQLEHQSSEAFSSKLNSVFFYLRGQTMIDQTWLSQTEGDDSLLRIESRDNQLQYTAQDGLREERTALAREYARAAYGFDPLAKPSNTLSPDVVQFDFDAGGDSYRAAVAVLPYGDTWLGVTLLKSRAREQAVRLRLQLGFAGCVVVSIALLCVFAWVFTGTAIRPVEESRRKQTEFVSAASHELRSPLSVIEMSAGTIRKIPAEAVNLADKIEGECKRLSRLIGDLLLLAGSDSGRWGIQTAGVSPKTVLLTTYERFDTLAASRGIGLGLQLPEQTLPNVNCDEQRVEQVLAIFIDNAMSYTPAGGKILLSVQQRKRSICFAVADSGPGIPDEEKERVFDRFYRADPSRTMKEHYGLGLAVAKEIALLHKGRVTVGDAALGGAEFVLSIPITPLTQ